MGHVFARPMAPEEKDHATKCPFQTEYQDGRTIAVRLEDRITYFVHFDSASVKVSDLIDALFASMPERWAKGGINDVAALQARLAIATPQVVADIDNPRGSRLMHPQDVVYIEQPRAAYPGYDILVTCLQEVRRV